MADQSQQGNQTERIQQTGAAAEGARAPRNPRPNSGGDGQRPPRQGQRNRNRNQGKQPLRREAEGGYFRDPDSQSGKSSNNQATGQDGRQANQTRSRNRSQNRQEQGPDSGQGQASSRKPQQGQARSVQGQDRSASSEGTGKPRKRNRNRNRSQTQGPRDGQAAEQIVKGNEEQRSTVEDNRTAAKPGAGEAQLVNNADKRNERQAKPDVEKRQPAEQVVPADPATKRKSEEAAAPLRDNQRDQRRGSRVQTDEDQNRNDDRVRSSKQNQPRNKQKIQLSQKMATKKKVSILDHQLKVEETAEDIRLDNLVIEKEIELVIAEIKAVSLGFN